MTQYKKESMELLTLATGIVSSRAANSNLSAEDISAMLKKIYKTMQDVTGEESQRIAGLVPFVPIQDSVKPDYIVCLEDGRKMKMLRRHLKTAYDMTPEEYREKWNLPQDYPMTAPNYAKRRSTLAKQIGLGKSR